MIYDPFSQPVMPYNGKGQQQGPDLKPLENYFKEQVIATFCTPHGLQLLDTLEDLYIRQPVCPPGCVEGYGYAREGENRLIRKIRNIVTQAQEAI